MSSEEEAPAEKEELSSDKVEENTEEEKTELAEHDRAEITVGDEPIQANEHYEDVVEVIMEAVGPEIEALKKKFDNCMAKLEEHEEKLKEHMSAPAEEPVQAKERMSATLTKKDFAWKKEPFNQKQAQYDMVLRAASKASKPKSN